MYNVRKVTEDIVWVGASDRRLALFENIFPIPRGVSYNSYVLLDEKTVLLDTVDASVAGQFFENLEHVLDGRKLDYLIVNHMEPDHCAMIGDLVRRYQDIWNDKTVLRNGFRGESRDGKRGRYAFNRCAYTALCDGADGTLAGGNGNL